MDFFETENAQFNSKLEKIKTSDRVHADVYNERFEKLINNDVYLDEKIDRRIEETKNLIGQNIGNSLQNVAKESSPFSIENGVNSIDTKATSISNLINTVNTNVTNINNVFSNVAKETTPKNIENKVIQLEDKIEELENYIKDKDISYLDLPNLNYNEVSLSNLITDTNYKTIINIAGSGYLVATLLKYSVNNTQKNIKGIKITLDNKVIYWQEVNVTNAKYSNGMCQMGISNAQTNSAKMQLISPLIQSYSFANKQEALRLSHFSNNKVIINSSEITFSSFDTSKVIFNKGLRFENSLRIEIVSDLTNKSINLYYLYSLDN